MNPIAKTSQVNRGDKFPAFGHLDDTQQWNPTCSCSGGADAGEAMFIGATSLVPWIGLYGWLNVEGHQGFGQGR